MYLASADGYYQVLTSSNNGTPLYLKHFNGLIADSLPAPTSRPSSPLSYPATFGVGCMTGPFYQANYFARRPRVPFKDSIPIFDHTLEQTIGNIPVIGKSLYTYEAKADSLGKNIRYFASDADRSPGLTSLEYLKVYDKRGDFVRMFQGRYGELETWIQLSEAQRIDSSFQYVSWMDYFKHFPKGSESWEHGYMWIGNEDYVRLSSSLEAPSVFPLTDSCEIYLTGTYQAEWAAVIVKEVAYTFTEGGYIGSKYGNTWKGWVRIVSPEGYPLLEEIILGC